MRDLFWLSDDAWAALEPHLPHNQPGKPRVDDRRVISGILHILKTGGRWRDVPPEMDRRRPSPTGTRAGRDEVSGSASSPRSRRPDQSQKSLRSTVQTSRRIARHQVEKGGVQPSGRRLARRQNNEDPLSGRWLWPDCRRRANTGQHGRHRHGGTAARGFGAGQTAHRRQSL